MVANTDPKERLIELCGQAISLARAGNRTAKQVEKLLQALQEFKNAPSAKQASQETEYPGCFNVNRCVACGGCIDSGGICPCGWDHNQKIKVA